MTKEIQLTRGKVTIVSDEWFDYLNQWKWHVVLFHGGFYAARKTSVLEGRKTILMHRVVAGAPADMQVDHIDRNPLNNIPENLRLCTADGNNKNRAINKANKTGYKGIYWTGKKYQAELTYHGKCFKLGTYNNPIEAAKAYDRKAKELHGEFACLNFPDDPTASARLTLSEDA